MPATHHCTPWLAPEDRHVAGETHAHLHGHVSCNGCLLLMMDTGYKYEFSASRLVCIYFSHQPIKTTRNPLMARLLVQIRQASMVFLTGKKLAPSKEKNETQSGMYFKTPVNKKRGSKRCTAWNSNVPWSLGVCAHRKERPHTSNLIARVQPRTSAGPSATCSSACGPMAELEVEKQIATQLVLCSR